jgi:hypothetical protein
MPPSRNLRPRSDEEEEDTESSTYLTDEAQPYVFRRQFPSIPTNSQPRKRNAVVLDSSPSSPSESEPVSAEQSVKRQRRPGERVRTGKATPNANARETNTPAEIEAIDLTEDANPLKDALQRQREDQIKAQREDAGKPLMLTKMQCVICMDTPTDLTATNCGMLLSFAS